MNLCLAPGLIFPESRPIMAAIPKSSPVMAAMPVPLGVLVEYEGMRGQLQPLTTVQRGLLSPSTTLLWNLMFSYILIITVICHLAML